MEQNKSSIYFYNCSNVILKRIAKLSNNKSLLDRSIKYAENFYGTEPVDEFWALLSTTLLMSENATEDIYKNIDGDTLSKIEEIITELEFKDTKNILLDENNQEINELKRIIIDKYTNPEDLEFYREHGCNNSIIDENKIFVCEKFVTRVRNAIAHSNYEIVDNDYIRLYHYNENTKKLDLNILLDKKIVLSIIDEINESKLKDYLDFVEEYKARYNELQFQQKLITEEELKQYLSTFKFLTKEKIKEVLKLAKKNDKFHTLDKNDITIQDNFERFTIIYNIIYQKYIEPFSYLIALTKITMDKLNDSNEVDSFLWNRMGYYSHFKIINNINKEDELDKKIKLLLIAFFNSTILYSFNINDDGNDINYNNLDFSKMKIDKKIIEVFEEKIYKSIDNKYSENITHEKKLTELAKNITKNKEILKNNSNINNKYFLEILPNQIDINEKQYNEKYQEQQAKKEQELTERYIALFEISDLKENINYTGNISKFIFRHLRNSLAHGHIEFPNGLNLDTLEDTIICFEDYDKDKDPKELTFRGFIKVNDLIEVVTNKKFIDEMFANYYTKQRTK